MGRMLSQAQRRRRVQEKKRGTSTRREKEPMLEKTGERSQTTANMEQRERPLITSANIVVVEKICAMGRTGEAKRFRRK